MNQSPDVAQSELARRLQATMRYVVPVLALCVLACNTEAPIDAADRPNIILFLVDDMGWMDSSAYGSKYYDTPNMERLARRGMLFTDAYAMPLCSPTRASILTGKHSSRHGITSASGHRPPRPKDAPLYPQSAAPGRRMIYAESRNFLDPAEYTLAEALRDAGYRTGHFGKWHLGLTEPHWPEKHGFETAFHGKPDPGPNSYFSPYGFRAFQSFPDGPPGEYITDRVTDEALKFIESNRGKPFFLNLWHYGVHGPWGHKVEYTKKLATRQDPRGKQGNPIMASMLKSIDESLGRVVAKLEELQITEETIVIFYSDNGGNTHSNTQTDRKTAELRPNHPRYAMIQDWRKWAGDQPPTNNSPLRDGKGRLYEGGIRVPLIVVWPGVVKTESRTSEIVGCIDLYPTVLDMARVESSDDQIIDGLSLLPLLKQSDLWDRDTYFTWFPHLVPGVAVRQGDWKLIQRFEPTEEYPDGFELFNLNDDLSESRNLAGERPAKVQEMRRLIDSFVGQTGAAIPKPNPKYRPRDANRRPLLGWVPESV